MPRLHSVAQHAVFDTPSAAMTANFHGPRPTLVTSLSLSYPPISHVSSCCRLERRRGSAGCLISALQSIRARMKGEVSDNSDYHAQRVIEYQ